MRHIEALISPIYDKVRKEVGGEYNGAFVPEEISRRLSTQIATTYNITVEPNYFLPAFWLKEVPLYPDAHEFLLNLGKHDSILSIIFTQGQVFDKGERGDVDNLGFQNHKIEVSGIPWYFGKNSVDKLKEHKLSLIHGGFKKTEDEMLRPILDVVSKLGLSVSYFDDLDSNLDEVGTFFIQQGIPVNLFWVNRAEQVPTTLSMPVSSITSFSEVDIASLEQSFVMLDYDGTVGDRIFMRKYLYDQVMAYAALLLPGK